MQSFFTIWHLLTFIILCNYNLQAQGNGVAHASAGPKMDVLKFKPAGVPDTKAGIDAYTVLIPNSWSFTGRAMWNLANTQYPATYMFKTSDATGDLQLEYFTDQFFLYSPGNTRPGGQSAGSTNATELPGAYQAMFKYLITPMRSSIQGTQVIEQKALIAEQTVSAGTQTGMLVRVEYNLNGKTYEENFYGLYVVNRLNPAESQWSLMNCFAFRAPKGQLESSMKIFETIMASRKLNADWYNKYLQVMDVLSKKTDVKTHEAVAAARITQQGAQAISDISKQKCNTAQQAMNETTGKFLDSLNLLETYHDASTQTIYKLPAGYKDAWNKTEGNCVVSKQASYDPNKDPGLNGGYKKLQKGLP